MNFASEHLQAFFFHCVRDDDDPGVGMNPDDLYGLYLTWCSQDGLDAWSSQRFTSALDEGEVLKGRTGCHSVYPGLMMTGPIAIQFIIETQRTL